MRRNQTYVEFCSVPQVKEELNNTTHFLLPSIEIPVRFLLLRQNGFINAYIDDAKNSIFYTDCLFLLFNPEKITKEYREFEDFLRSLSNYVTDYDVNRNQILFVFKIKDKWRNNLKKFKESKYSQFDKEYIKSFFNPTIRQNDKNVPNKYYQIMTKDPEYKKKLEHYFAHLDGVELHYVVIPEENELASPINPLREIYRLKNYYNEVSLR